MVYQAVQAVVVVAMVALELAVLELQVKETPVAMAVHLEVLLVAAVAALVQ